jgi:hypothetical protein
MKLVDLPDDIFLDVITMIEEEWYEERAPTLATMRLYVHLSFMNEWVQTDPGLGHVNGSVVSLGQHFSSD